MSRCSGTPPARADNLTDYTDGVRTVDGIRGGDGEMLSPDSDAKIRTSQSTSAAIMSCEAERRENRGLLSM